MSEEGYAEVEGGQGWRCPTGAVLNVPARRKNLCLTPGENEHAGHREGKREAQENMGGTGDHLMALGSIGLVEAGEGQGSASWDGKG